MKRIETRHYTATAEKEFRIERVQVFLNVPSERSGPYIYDHITPFQLLIETTEDQLIDVFIPWQELSPSYLRNRSLFMRYDEDKERWTYVASTRETTGYRLKVSKKGVYALAYNLHQELQLVDEVVSGFPDWYAAKSDPTSNVRRLTNALLTPYLAIESGVEEAAALSNLYALDESQLSEIHRYVAPEIGTVDRARVFLKRSGFYEELVQAESVEDLIFDPTKAKVLVDFKRGAVLSLEPYDEVEVELELPTGRQYITTSRRQEALWNDFDELGLLYGMKRMTGEKNISFKQRLSTLFSHPGNATKLGVLYETARELGQIIHHVWQDDSKGLLIENTEGRSIIKESIQVDGQPVIVEWQPDGGFLIPPSGTKRPREVVFFYGVHSYRPSRALSDDQGRLTDYHDKVYGEIGNRAPVLYGQAKWGIQEWDMTVDEGLIEWFGPMDHDSENWRD